MRSAFSLHCVWKAYGFIEVVKSFTEEGLKMNYLVNKENLFQAKEVRDTKPGLNEGNN